MMKTGAFAMRYEQPPQQQHKQEQPGDDGQCLRLRVKIDGAQRELPVQVPRSTCTVTALMEIVANLTKLHVRFQVPMYRGESLSGPLDLPEDSLVDIAIRRTRGGPSVNFKLPEVEKTRVRQTGENKYQAYWVVPGLNYEVEPCKTPGCPAKDEPQVVTKGFGEFRPAEDVDFERIVCSCCASPAKLLVFVAYNTKATVMYKRAEAGAKLQKKIIKAENEVMDLGRSEDNKVYESAYSSFHIKCEPLHQLPNA